MKSTALKYVIMTITVPSIIGGIWLLGYWWLMPLYHSIWVITRHIAVFILFTLIVGVITIILYETDHDGLAITLGLSGFVFLMVLIPVSMYESSHALYEASAITTSTDADELSYQERAPYDVAKATSSRTLGNTNGDAKDEIAYIPSLGTWSTTVNRRGMGYDSIQEMKLPNIGEAKSSNVKFCSFAKSSKRSLKGNLWYSSLAVQIARETTASVTYDADDSFAVCDNGTPYVYVPLRTMRGFLFPYSVPAGVAVYNGSTGELTIEKNLKNSKYPVYPMSIANEQRNSMKASGNMWSWMTSASGYETTATDDGDPNGSNHGEFSLLSSTGHTQYVSPLTPRGSSSSIVAVGVMDSETINDGRLSSLSLHTYPKGKSRIANTTIEQTIKSNILSGYRSNNLTVFEIVPTKNGEWTATVGSSQTTIYRATVTVDGEITMKDMNGNTVSSTDGNDDSTSDDSTASIPDDVKPSKPLSSMTPAELNAWSKKLLDEANQVNAELAKRAGNTK
jgi:hypothetical protein